LTLGALATAAGAQAHAAAWIEDKRTIASAAIGQVGRAESGEVDYYTERATWRGRMALVTKSWLRRQGPAVEGETSVGVKAGAALGPHVRVAAQASAFYPADAPGSCGRLGAEPRLMVGAAAPLGRGAAFANAEFAYRAQRGCDGDKVEATMGYRTERHWLLLAQVDQDRSFHGTETIKVQWSAVRFGARGRGLQLGVRLRTDGADREPALVFGYWSG